MVIKYTTGYAGTGKSTELLKLLRVLPVKSSVCLAPTHKALARLQQDIPKDLAFGTLHSFLGWVPSINEEAIHPRHIDIIVRRDKDIEDYEHIVIDEAGMMSIDMLLTLTGKLEELHDFDTEHITLHLFLDPYQLLPVKGVQIQCDEAQTTNLTTQYRAESLDIVSLYTKFVRFLEGTNKKDLTTPYSENVLPLDISKFKEGDRLLAYTNKAVGAWNLKLAKHLGVTSYEGQMVQLGNLVNHVYCESFISPSLKQLLKLYEEGLLALQNRQIKKAFLGSSLAALIKNKHISFITDGTYTYPVIVGIGKANIIIKEAKTKAVSNRSKFVEVYALGRAYIMDYSFASTVHKAQGSEFTSIFIDKKDIQQSIYNSYYDMYVRLLYVSMSRAIKTIYI